MVLGFEWSLVVYAFIEQHAQRPPVDFGAVAAAFVDFGSEVGEGAGFAGQLFARSDLGCHVLTG